MDACRRKKEGEAQTIWRRTTETELTEMDLTWEEAQSVAKDKIRKRRGIVSALCPTGGLKDNDDDYVENDCFIT